MTVPLRFAWNNRANFATLTVGSSVGNLTGGKLLTDDIQEIWRSAASPDYIIADLTAQYEIGAIALINSNAASTDTARFRVSNSDSTGATGEIYDSGSISAGVDSFERKLVHFVEPAVTGRYVRIDLTQSAAAPEGGRLFIGPTWTPSKDRAYGEERVWQDWSNVTATRGLNLIRDRRARQHGQSFRILGLTESEIENQIDVINRDIGMSADMLVCLDVDNAATKTSWGPMATMIRRPRSAYQFWQCEFTIWNRL